VPESALNAAVISNNNDMVSLILSHGAKVNGAVDTDGNTALHMALHKDGCRRGRPGMSNTNVIETLLEAGANVNISNKEGKTPMHLAVDRNKPGVFDKLLSHRGNPNKALHYACERKHVKIAEILLKAGADPNLTDSETSGKLRKLTHVPPLCAAVAQDNYELAELLLNYGADANSTLSSTSTIYPGYTALHISLQNMKHGSSLPGIRRQRDAMSRMLVERGADVNQLTPDGHSPLSLAIHFVRKDVHGLVRTMIRNGAELDDSRNNVGKYSGVLSALCAWRREYHAALELFKAGAGFQLTASCFQFQRKLAHCIQLCQAVVMAGYKPDDKELQAIRHSKRRPIPVYVELLGWLTKDRQEAPSLMRQCRVAIRRQLFVASAHRTIIPAIDQLTALRSKLRQYLKFEGPLTEVDLKVVKMNKRKLQGGPKK